MNEYIKNFLDKICCKHDWEELKRINVYDEFSLESDLPIRFKYLYKCKKCGKFKIIKM